MKHFLKFFFASQAFGILAVIFVLIVVVYRKDKTITSSGKEFLWHPVLMALSMGYLFGTSITIYRALRYLKKLHLKWVHAGINLAAIAFAIGGLVAAMDTRTNHLKSLHSLMGIITVLLFCIQWTYSFLLFLHPKGPGIIRAMIMPYHVIAGLVMYITALCTTVTGINEYNWTADTINTESVLLNFAGFFFLINAILVAYMLLREDFKREPIDEDHKDESEEISYG